MRMAIELGTPSKTRPCRANGSSVRVTRPALFAQKQAVGIIVESPALRDRPPLDSNRGQCEEKGRERRGEERRVRKDDCMMSVLKDQGRMLLPSDVPPSYRLCGFLAQRSFQLQFRFPVPVAEFQFTALDSGLGFSQLQFQSSGSREPVSEFQFLSSAFRVSSSIAPVPEFQFQSAPKTPLSRFRVLVSEFQFQSFRF